MRGKILACAAVAASLFTGTAHAAESHVTFGLNNGRDTGFSSGVYLNDDATNPNNHQITHYCNYSAVDNAGTTVFVLYGEATATWHLTPVATGIHCELRDQNNVILHQFSHADPGPQTAWAETFTRFRPNGPYTICSQGSGMWNDTHQILTPLNCQQPNVPPLPIGTGS